MPPIVIYGLKMSAPCRTVAITCDLLGIPYEWKITDLFKGETMTEEYLKMNPQHTIPTIKDGDFVLSESRAIACYLANAYEKGDSVYPKDPKVRAIVDHRLYFDIGVLLKACFSVMVS